jgi:hypothetical protein
VNKRTKIRRMKGKIRRKRRKRKETGKGKGKNEEDLTKSLFFCVSTLCLMT